MLKQKGYAPGWVAECLTCSSRFDLASLGYIRIAAYSYGKRTRIHCPNCERRQWMRIIHLDEDGKPDQSFGKVLGMVLLYQAVIWIVVLGILALVFRFLW